MTVTDQIFTFDTNQARPEGRAEVIQPEGSKQALNPIGKWRFEHDRLNV